MKFCIPFFLTVLIPLTFLSVSCEKDAIKRVMDTSTDSIEVTGATVVAYGTVLDIGENSLVEHGHCWATHNNPIITDFHSTLGPINERIGFKTMLNFVQPGVTHYVRSYLYDGNNYTYGEVKDFVITAEDIAFLTEPPRKLNFSTIEISSSTTGLGSVNFANHGHCWSLTDPPTIDDNKTSFGPYSADVRFTSEIQNAVLGSYYLRGYLENEGVVIYTNTVVYESIITVGTRTVVVNANNTVQADGEILSLGDKQIIQHGHCWSSTTSNPNYNSNKNLLGPIYAPGYYSSQIQGLLSGVIYYIRAYASDGTNVYYGEVTSFVTN